MGYEWLGTALDKLKGIEPYEVMQALDAERRWPRPAVGYGDIVVMTIWARTHAGRPLIVGVRQAGTWEWLIIGARDMRPTELAAFQAWEEEAR